MKYNTCRCCGFFPGNKQLICPDCGSLLVRHPSESVANIVALVLVFAGVYLYGAVSGFRGKGGDEKEIYIGMALIFVAFAAYAAIAIVVRESLARRRKATLRNYETKIRLRITEMERANSKIKETIGLASSTSFGSLANETLARADSALSRLLDEYNVKLRDIEWIRFVNRFEAIRITSTSHSYDRCKEVIANFDALQASFLDRFREWNTLPLSNTPSGQACIRKWKELMNLAKSVREELIARQVRRTVKDISPLELDLQDSTLPQGVNIVTHIHALEAELERLEHENIRLKSEDEVSQSGLHG